MNHTPLAHISWLLSLALGAALAGQDSPAIPHATLGSAHAGLATVLFDSPGDGRLWALGATYKASFGQDGFVYVPFLGSDAPRNHPVRFTLRSVRVAGRDVAFTAGATAVREGARVTLDRGTVHEVYDLAAAMVEQTFVIDGAAAGDVDIELAIATDLAADVSRDGLQFGNELGHVAYGTAYLVRGTAKTAIATTWTGDSLRLHVPAAWRDAGQVVIDPVIRTVSLNAGQLDATLPDLAYDATTDRWLATWVNVFSQTDHDVVAELRTGNGDPIAGSFRAIEATTAHFTSPRTANLASADRFLIAMERAGTVSPLRPAAVWGRTMDAASPFGTGALIEISPPSNLDQHAPDVGGDPGTGAHWTVVWEHGGESIGAADILARQVDAAGTVRPNTIAVENLPHVCTWPQISLSNGNGLSPTPRWCVVFNVRATATDADVWGSMLDLAGVVTRDRAITTAFSNDVFPQVSSPVVDFGGTPRFLVSFEQWTAVSEFVARVVDTDIVATFPEVNLSRRYGFNGQFSRIDSDGARFAATTKVGTSLRVGTLALVANDLVLHEGLQTISSGDFPHIASKRSGGGGNTDYGIVYISPGNPSRAAFATYQGRAPAGGFNWRDTDCGPGIDVLGQPFVGNTLQFSLTGTGTDLAGFVFGLPAAATILCGTCRVGVDLAQATVSFGGTANLRLPGNPRFVGFTVAAQGFTLGSGPCNPAARTSDTIDATIQ
jgi:hypothetical protein